MTGQRVPEEKEAAEASQLTVREALANTANLPKIIGRKRRFRRGGFANPREFKRGFFDKIGPTQVFLETPLEFMQVGHIIGEIREILGVQRSPRPIRFLERFWQRDSELFEKQRGQTRMNPSEKGSGGLCVENPGEDDSEIGFKRSNVVAGSVEYLRNARRFEKVKEGNQGVHGILFFEGQRIDDPDCFGVRDLNEADFGAVSEKSVGFGVDGQKG